MWQPIVATLLVVLAAMYAARTLGPRRWRRRSRAGAKDAASAPCGCGKDQGGCR